MNAALHSLALYLIHAAYYKILEYYYRKGMLKLLDLPVNFNEYLDKSVLKHF